MVGQVCDEGSLSGVANAGPGDTAGKGTQRRLGDGHVVQWS